MFQNKSFNQAIESILFSFKNGRNVIISGKQEVGKIALAVWAAQYFEEMNNCFNPNESSLFIYTEDDKPFVLIGYKKPANKKTIENGGKIIAFEEGNLVKSIRKGKVCILDNVDQLQPTATERLIAYLDKK